MFHHTGCRLAVTPEPVIDPAHQPQQTTLVVDQTEDDCANNRHEHRARNCCRTINRARPPQRNRDNQPQPQQHIENHCRSKPGRCQGKPSVGLGDSRTGDQAKPQGVARRTSPRQQAAKGAGAQLNAKEIKPPQSVGVGPEGCVGDQRVAVQRNELQPDGSRKQDRVNLAQVTNGAPKGRHERQNKEIDDYREKHPTQCLPHTPSVRAKSGDCHEGNCHKLGHEPPLRMSLHYR